MSGLFGLNGLRWYVRVPIKWMIFALTFLAVCFPHPGLLVRHARHWRDPNALIEPDAPALQPLVRELRPLLTKDLPPGAALDTVRDFVYEKIEYGWDWETWGMADYLPTVTEAVAMGREDCDGRAVVAASLLRNFGYESEIVTDFMHVWVKTDKGETMGPGRKKAVVATEDGVRLRPGALAQVPQAMAYGVAVFPLARELIVLAVLWLLLLHPKGGAGRSLVALALLVVGLLVLRFGSEDHLHPVAWMQLAAAGALLAGCSALLVWGRTNARSAGQRVPTSAKPLAGDGLRDGKPSIPDGGEGV